MGISYRKRGDTWEYRFDKVTINGKRKQMTKSGFKTKKEAEQAGIKAYNEFIQHGEPFVPSEISVTDFYEKWQSTYCATNLNDITRRNYAKKINNYIIPVLGEYKLRYLNTTVLQKFINDLYDRGFSRNTLSSIKGILTSSMNYAVEPLHYIASSPMNYVNIPSKRVVAKVATRSQPHVFISKEDMELIFKRFPEGTSAHIPIMLGYKAGLRLGEAYGLLWEDIDLENKTLTVNRQVQWKDSTDEENGYWYFANPKYDSVRTITLDSELCRLLSAEKERQMKNEVKYDEYYFHYYSAPNTRMLNQDENGREVHLVCVRECGEYIQPRTMQHASSVIHNDLNIQFTFHSLRHTHCSMLLTAGAKPKYVQERLGHKNIQVTLGVYQHLTQGMKTEGDEILDSMYK
ncbi:MAG: site-specific integrase [Ruminococcus sp.]|nr:site-specific integrase [Ruminococcus sp.]